MAFEVDPYAFRQESLADVSRAIASLNTTTRCRERAQLQKRGGDAVLGFGAETLAPAPRIFPAPKHRSWSRSDPNRYGSSLSGQPAACLLISPSPRRHLRSLHAGRRGVVVEAEAERTGNGGNEAGAVAGMLRRRYSATVECPTSTGAERTRPETCRSFSPSHCRFRPKAASFPA